MSTYFKSLLKKYYKNTASQHERWMVDQFFERLQKGGIRHEEIEKNIHLKQRLGDKIFKRTINRNSKKRWIYPSAAASIIFIIGIMVFYQNQSVPFQTQVTDSQEKRKIYLPDSSVVFLNSNSRLTYPKSFKQSTRSVQLEGEAYFKIRRNDKKDFIVESPDLEIRVLGTSFNVNNYSNNQAAVTVSSGKVQVDSKHDSRQVTLQKNQRAILGLEPIFLDTSTVNVNEFIAWHWEKIHFQQAPLQEVIIQLSKRFDTNIILKSSSENNCAISGTFAGGSLEDVLEGLKFIHDIDYQRQSNGSYVLYAGPCNLSSSITPM